jgi:hypothetical protein
VDMSRTTGALVIRKSQRMNLNVWVGNRGEEFGVPDLRYK